MAAMRWMMFVSVVTVMTMRLKYNIHYFIGDIIREGDCSDLINHATGVVFYHSVLLEGDDDWHWYSQVETDTLGS